MDIKKVEGEDRGHIMIYALSTCGWCKKTKEFIESLGIEYYHVDVDHLQGHDRKKAMDELVKWNSSRSFPTIVINDEKAIVGFKKDELKEALGI